MCGTFYRKPGKRREEEEGKQGLLQERGKRREEENPPKQLLRKLLRNLDIWETSAPRTS